MWCPLLRLPKLPRLRTFDRDVLAQLGAKGMDGDLVRARGWYERASQDGNTKAAERLKILASLSGTDPSD